MVKSLTIEVLKRWLFKASVHALPQEMLIELVLIIKSSELLLLISLLLVLMVFERVFLLEAIRKPLRIWISTLRKLKLMKKIIECPFTLKSFVLCRF
jgi:hypothetical protein